MKIGILAYHAACNFGANLQVLSTVCYLRDIGHEPIVINWYSEELEKFYSNNTNLNQFKEHKHFREKYFPLTKRCYNDEDIVRELSMNNIQALIVGSDAVVQHHPILSRIVFPSRKVVSISYMTKDRLFPNPFWGSFYNLLTSKIPLIWMSVSSQNSNYKLILKSEKKQMKKYIQNFSYISVRDNWTSKMFQYITNNKIIPEITPDPVFAFNQNVSFQPTKEEVLKKFNLPENYYLLSFLNDKYVSEDWLNEFESLAEKNNIACVALPFPQGIKFSHNLKYEVRIPLSSLDWYALIKYSKAYIGNNMHPIVVCLHNGIPCISFDNYGLKKYRFFTDKKSSKIYHIMNKFNILEYHFRVRNKLNLTPSPSHLLNLIQSFPTKQVKLESVATLQEYNTMMNEILNIVKQ